MDTTSVRETRQAEYVLALVQARVVRVQVVLCRTYWTNRPRFHMRLFVHGFDVLEKLPHTASVATNCRRDPRPNLGRSGRGRQRSRL